MCLDNNRNMRKVEGYKSDMNDQTSSWKRLHQFREFQISLKKLLGCRPSDFLGEGGEGKVWKVLKVISHRASYAKTFIQHKGKGSKTLPPPILAELSCTQYYQKVVAQLKYSTFLIEWSILRFRSLHVQHWGRADRHKASPHLVQVLIICNFHCKSYSIFAGMQMVLHNVLFDRWVDSINNYSFI